MNYQKIYDSIINRAKLRGLNKKLLNYYTEKHHIIPRCIGGFDEDSNYVLLTAKEHYLCHYLLHKIYDNNVLLLVSLYYMCFGKSYATKHRYKPLLTSKQFETIKLKSKCLKRTWSSKESENGMSKECFIDDIKFQSIKEASYYAYEKYGMTYSSTIKAFNNAKKVNFIKADINKHKGYKRPWNKNIKAPQCANANRKNNSKPFMIDDIRYNTLNDAVEKLKLSKHKIRKLRVFV